MSIEWVIPGEGGNTGVVTVELYGCTLYFSVRDPVYVQCVPQPFYLEDGDVAGINLITGDYELKSKGVQMGIYDLDAMSLVPLRMLFWGWGPAGIGDPGGPVFRK